jgi:copper(I)-binding protein
LGSKVAAGYVTIRNTGTEPDRLLGASADAAGRAEIHESVSKGKTVEMRPLPKGLEIPPNATVELKPGGSHLMLIGLTRPLRKGEQLKGTLNFEKAGTVEVTFDIEAMGARAPGHGGHTH